MMIAPILMASLLAGQTEPGFDPGPNPLLLRKPTLSATTLVFQYAGDLWKVARSGGEAVRLTSAEGLESDPKFSPDGKWVAFTGQYDGNADAFVVPIEGGVPKRLTAHPSPDSVSGWTPDGKSVVFASDMLSNTDNERLFTVPVSGGVPKPLPFPSGTFGSFSPDGSQIAYNPGFKWQQSWKRYRGGQTSQIWIGQLGDSRVKEIPRKNTNDENPMWVGDKVYYLSDPRGPVGLFSYDTKTGKVAEEVPGYGFDLKSASSGPGAIAYEKLGGLYLYDLKSRSSKRVPIEVRGDFPEVRPQFKALTGYIQGQTISPSGSRVAVTARGWLFSVPAAKGDARPLSEIQGVHRRDPAWSPDGKTLAYISDQNSKQQLALLDLGTNAEKFVDLAESPAYYFAPVWSPDGKSIAYTDNRLSLWVLDVATGKSTLVDKGTYTDPNTQINPKWSPDSKWLTWARDLDSHMNAVYVYSLESGKRSQITDGLSNAKLPIFDRDGKHLYFVASTNTGQAASWLDMSSLNNPNVLSSLYAVVLRKDGPNPLQAESDEETPKDAAKPAPPKPEDAKFRIDLDGIEDRIITLSPARQAYLKLEPATPGSLFAVVAAPMATATDFGGPPQILKYSFADRKLSPWTQGATDIVTTPDGTKALVSAGSSYRIVPTMAPAAPGQGAVDLSGLRAKVDPKTEWAKMFEEIWRNEPILFYADNLHGIDAKKMADRYRPFVVNVASRDDLNYLIVDMMGEVVIGHMFPGGGDVPGAKRVGGGLLGCDFTFENGRYKLTRIYNGERWNPGLYAPLAQPGINAKPGEYLLAIDGKDLNDATDIYEKLEGKAGRQVKLRLGPTADGKDSREVTVQPVGSELALRRRAWIEDCRRYVEKETKGRAGYVHVPDTAQGGWTEFNRYYYAQTDKDGIIVDERFNQGGLINDFMIREMTKKLDAVFTPRHGKDWPTPGATIFGPKVMLINQFAGSGGDMFPWMFRQNNVGKLVGKRTWGGLVASFGFPLIDGGRVNAPDCAFYNPHTGKWDVENWGVSPDIDVELDPYLWRQGIDSQLKAAVDQINKELATYQKKELKRPANPDKRILGIRW